MLRREPALGSVAILLVAVFVLALFAVHLIEPENNFGPVSLYSLGPYGFVMQLGFLVLGVAFFALAWGLEDQTKHTALFYLDEALLLTAGSGLTLISLFNTDPIGTAPTVHGLIHSWSALAWSIAASVGMSLFAVAFRQDGRRLAIGKRSRNLGFAAVAVFLSGFLSYGTFFAPVQPRLFFSIVAVWVLLIGTQLRLGRLAIAPEQPRNH